MIEIAKLWLPLTRELSSEERLRERKGCVFMRSYFSPSVFLLTQKATSLVRGRQEIVVYSLRHPLHKGGYNSYLFSHTNPYLSDYTQPSSAKALFPAFAELGFYFYSINP